MLQYRILDLINLMLLGVNFPEGFKTGVAVRGFDVGPVVSSASDGEQEYLLKLESQIGCVLSDMGYAVRGALRPVTNLSPVVRSLIPMTGARVLVVGAGIVGRSIAYYLSRAGAQSFSLKPVMGISDASRASLGVLTHFSGGHSVYGLFIRDSHAAHRPLADELFNETGIDVGWRPLRHRSRN